MDASCPGPNTISVEEFTGLALTSSAQYDSKLSCQTIVTSSRADRAVTLTLKLMDLAPGHFVEIYDGPSVQGTLLTVFGGRNTNEFVYVLS
jgi:hypothetical protein